MVAPEGCSPACGASGGRSGCSESGALHNPSTSCIRKCTVQALFSEVPPHSTLTPARDINAWVCRPHIPEGHRIRLPDSASCRTTGGAERPAAALGMRSAAGPVRTAGSRRPLRVRTPAPPTARPVPPEHSIPGYGIAPPRRVYPFPGTMADAEARPNLRLSPGITRPRGDRAGGRYTEWPQRADGRCANGPPTSQSVAATTAGNSSMTRTRWECPPLRVIRTPQARKPPWGDTRNCELGVDAVAEARRGPISSSTVPSFTRSPRAWVASSRPTPHCPPDGDVLPSSRRPHAAGRRMGALAFAPRAQLLDMANDRPSRRSARDRHDFHWRGPRRRHRRPDRSHRPGPPRPAATASPGWTEPTYPGGGGILLILAAFDPGDPMIPGSRCTAAGPGGPMGRILAGEPSPGPRWAGWLCPSQGDPWASPWFPLTDGPRPPIAPETDVNGSPPG